MGLIGLFLFLAAVFVWAPAAWIYFDSVQRRQAPYLWAFMALIPWFNLVVLVAYLVLRARSATPQAALPDTRLPDTRLAVYLHVAVLTFWGLTAVGLTALAYGPLHMLREQPTEFDAPAAETLRQTLAFAVAVLVIAGPALGVHLWMAARALRADRATIARLADGLRLLLTVLGALTTTLAIVVLIFWGIGLLFQLGEVDMEEPTSLMFSLLPASMLSVAAGLWLLPRGEPADGGASD